MKFGKESRWTKISNQNPVTRNEMYSYPVFLSSEVTYILKHVFESSPCTRLTKYFIHINHGILYKNPTFSCTLRTVGWLLTNIGFPYCICVHAYFPSTAPQLLNKEYAPLTQIQRNDFYIPWHWKKAMMTGCRMDSCLHLK